MMVWNSQLMKIRIDKMSRSLMGILKQLHLPKLGMSIDKFPIQLCCQMELHKKAILSILMGIPMRISKMGIPKMSNRMGTPMMGMILPLMKQHMVMKHMKFLKLRISHLCCWLRSRKSRSHIQLIQLELEYRFLELRWSR